MTEIASIGDSYQFFEIKKAQTMGFFINGSYRRKSNAIRTNVF
jgi:hypothetical protein